jgi:hypothetical protein
MKHVGMQLSRHDIGVVVLAMMDENSGAPDTC